MRVGADQASASHRVALGDGELVDQEIDAGNHPPCFREERDRPAGAAAEIETSAWP